MKSMPSKSEIFEHWMTWLDKKGLDWGEPCCWACGIYFGNLYDFDMETVSKGIRKKDKSDMAAAIRKKIISNWNRVPLQRCHIVGRQFGGSNDPGNLFLMCTSCHDKAPNTKSQSLFMEWVSMQEYSKNLTDSLMTELNNFGLLDKAEEVCKIMLDERFRHEFIERIGLHKAQEGKGLAITMSSYVGVVKEMINSKET